MGPIACPLAYTTVSTSEGGVGSTLVACCPSDYTFVSLCLAGSIGECTSPLTTGATVTYMMESTQGDTTGGVMTTSTMMAAPYFVVAVLVNKMLFEDIATSTTDLRAITSSIFAATSSTSASATASTVSTTPPPYSTAVSLESLLLSSILNAGSSTSFLNTVVISHSQFSIATTIISSRLRRTNNVLQVFLQRVLSQVHLRQLQLQ